MNPRINHRHVLAKLATGPIYERDTDYWLTLKGELERVRAHYAEMGLIVVVDESAGYAYLRQEADDAAEGWDEARLAPVPIVLRRRKLSYHQTLLLVLLRERLLRHEQSSGADAQLYLKEEDLLEMLRPYFPESNNEKKFRDKALPLLRRADELNILSPLKNRAESIYRVEQIIKAKLPPELIAEIRARLAGPPGDLSENTDPADSPDGSSEDTATFAETASPETE
jgi:hypothetical protein